MSSGNFNRSKNKVIGGVCGGLAKLMGYEAVWVRLVFLFLTIFTGFFIGILVYAILWAVIPEE